MRAESEKCRESIKQATCPYTTCTTMDLLCLQICSSEKKRKKEKKEKPAHALAVSKMIFVCHSKIDG